MKIKVDYHFHPNLPLHHLAAMRKVKRIYKRCQELGINTLLITEHVYKKPKRAFDYMNRLKPDGFFIFPGMEYITKEKIDIIIFSKDSSLYEMQELKPYALNYLEVVELVEKNDNLQAFVTHPFTFGTTSVVRRKGMGFTKKMIERLGAVEVSYTVFSPVKRMLNRSPFLVRNMFGKALYTIDLNEFFPEEFYPDRLKFLAAGSDAHHVKEIGTHCVIDRAVEANLENVFDAITTNKDLDIVWMNNHNPLSLMRSSITTLREYMTKNGSRLKSRKKDSFNKEFYRSS